MIYVKAFLVGGLICVVGQILLDKTKMGSPNILVSFVTIGVLLGALNVYEPLVEWAGAGATIPLTGFGNVLAKGAIEGAARDGWLGAFTGGLAAAAGGTAAAVFFGYLVALIFKPKTKK